MKLKKIICLIAAAAIFLVLTACGGNSLTLGEPYYLKITFPKTMQAVDLKSLTDDTVLDQRFDRTQLTDFRDNDGGLFFARDFDRGSEASLASSANSVTTGIWELKAEDADTIVSLYKEIASSFNSEGYTVVDKDDFDQGSAHFIYIELKSARAEKADTIYVSTVKNGQQFSLTYTADEITDQTRAQAEKIYRNIFFTETISTEEKQVNRPAMAALLILGLAVIAVIIVGIISIVRRRRAEKDSRAYVSQFSDRLNPNPNDTKDGDPNE